MIENSTKKVEIFYSYAHEDKEFRNDLAMHLGKSYISSWYDREILAGKEWDKEIDNHLNSADIILLLISSDFLGSAYCSGKEMKRALERHEAGEAYVIPVILRDVLWQDEPFSKLQVLPTDGRPVTSWFPRDRAFVDIAIGIRKVLDEILCKKYIIDAKSYSAENKYEQALVAYEQASHHAQRVPKFQDDHLLNVGKGDILDTLQRYQEALEAYKKAVEKAPQDIQVLVKIAQVLVTLKGLPEALKYYDRAISIHRDPLLYISKGDVLRDLHEYEDALAAYEQAISYDKANPHYYKKKGDILRSLQRYKDALKAYEDAINLQQNFEFYFCKGDTYFVLKSYEDALTAYEKAIELENQNAQIWRNKGRALRYLQRPEEALVDYKKAVDLDPSNPYLYKEKGDILSDLERYEEALVDYQDAIYLDLSFGVAYESKSIVLRKLAKQIYDKLMLQADQDHERARQLRATK